MLRVVTGPFHPHLQSALVERIRQRKFENPLAPLIVLVPSSTLVRHLQQVLALEAGLTLLNVHIWTFHQFALRLRDEQRQSLSNADEASTDPAGTRLAQPPSVTIVDQLFFEQAIRQLLQHEHAGFEPFRRIGRSSGTWGALWATIRDLRDAMVDGQVAGRAVDEGYFGEEDRAWLSALFNLYGAVGTLGSALHVGTPDDLARSLLPVIAESAWLQPPAAVLYYGFYDLTQVQLSVLDAVARCADTTLFFPLSASGDGDEFARRFFERHLQPLIGSASDWQAIDERGSSRPVPTPLDTTVYSVVGTEEALSAACRLIIDAVDTHGYAWNEIGLVARSLEPYRLSAEEVFARHRVPIQSAITTPLIHHPLAKTLVHLANLPAQDGDSAALLDLLSSPFFRHQVQAADAPYVRPDLWRILVQTLGIVRGSADWSRLTRYGLDAVQLRDASDAQTDPQADAQDNAQTEGQTYEPARDRSDASLHERIPPAVAQSLWHIVSELSAACAALPAQGSVGQLLAAYRALLDRFVLRAPAAGTTNQGDPDPGDEDPALWQAIDQALAALGELDPLVESLTWFDFAELLIQSIERRSLTSASSAARGVHVLDAMAARGLPFKLLILIGLNEQMFPRTIREDAFLRDRHRRVLEATLGFKIDEKLTGYDEEALLFDQLCRAAGHRLVLIYQRADDEGRVLAPSPYLAQLTRHREMGVLRVEGIARRLDDRLRQRPQSLHTVPPRELLHWHLLEEDTTPVAEPDRSALLTAVGHDPAFYRLSAQVVRMQDDEMGELTPYDGAIGPLPHHWERALQRGLSPTALQRYAQCPFRYFATQVLRVVATPDRVEQDIDPRVFGTLLHAALRRVYQDLIDSSWPTIPLTDSDRTRRIEAAVTAAAADYAEQHARGYALLWQMTQERVAALIAAAVQADEVAAQDDPFVPIRCEWEGEGAVPAVGAQDLPIKIHGTVDRLDRLAESHALRVVDYKLKLSSAMPQEDRDLVRAAVRAQHLQPPLYSCLTMPEGARVDHVQFLYLAPNWTPPVQTRTFSTALWSQDVGRTLRATLGTLVDGIRDGRFPILTGDYCDGCEFRTACRKTHKPTVWRTRRSETVRTLRAIRRITLDKTSQPDEPQKGEPQPEKQQPEKRRAKKQPTDKQQEGRA